MRGTDQPHTSHHNRGIDKVLQDPHRPVDHRDGRAMQDVMGQSHQEVSLSIEIEERQRHLEQSNQFLHALEKKNADLRQRSRELASWRQDTAKQLNAVKQDLAAVRFLAPNEQSDEEKDPVQAFNQVEKAISRLVADVIALLPHEILQSNISDGLRGRKELPSRTLTKFFIFANRNHGSAQMKALMHIALHFAVCSWLMRNIYMPFVPGMSREHDGTLRGMLRSVQAAETQDRSGRWRAITYSYLKRDIDACKAMSRDLMAELLSLLNAFRRLEVSEDVIISELEFSTTGVLERAVTFQDMAQTSYTNFTVEAAMLKESKYEAKWMRVVKGRGQTSRSIIPIGIGLFTVRYVSDKQGNLVEQDDCIHCVPIISDDWVP